MLVGVLVAEEVVVEGQRGNDRDLRNPETKSGEKESMNPNISRRIIIGNSREGKTIPMLKGGHHATTLQSSGLSSLALEHIRHHITPSALSRTASAATRRRKIEDSWG